MKVLLIILGALMLIYLGTAFLERYMPHGFYVRFERLMGRFTKPVAGVLPGWIVLETRGRLSGLPRAVPVGGTKRGDTVWVVAANGRASQYVKNIEVDPGVRVRVRGRWRDGTATLCPEISPHRRMWRNPMNGAFLLLSGTDRLTIRIDLR